MENMVIQKAFWKNRKVFITGHTGFKGGWLTFWLKSLKAEVTGYSLEPNTAPAIFYVANIKDALKENIVGDIRDLSRLTNCLKKAEPTIVIHMAAQALVRDSYIDPVHTYSTNVMGTVNLLEAVRKTKSVKAVLNITSDKCYENKEWLWGYRENEPMGGHDPYSSSKGCGELISSAYLKSFFQQAGTAIATARAGNVIGGGDWAKDRIVPDAIRAFIDRRPLVIRNPNAVRPWQHVLEPLSGYLILCQHLITKPNEYSGGWNFGPDADDAKPVSALADCLTHNWGEHTKWGYSDGDYPHEARYLKLDCSKAKTKLQWFPKWRLQKAIHETVLWYKAYERGENMHEFTMNQIKKYQTEQNK